MPTRSLPRRTVPVFVAIALAAGCRTTAVPPSITARETAFEGGLRVRAEASRDAGAETMRFRVVFRNEGTAPRNLEFGACPLFPELRRDDRVAWDYSRIERPCLMYLAVPTIPPGDSLAAKEFALTIPLRELRGDSLAAGEYDVTLKATWDNETHALPAGRLTLP